MTKKDYIRMAAIFAEALQMTKTEPPCNGTAADLMLVIKEYIKMAKADNPRFNEERFRKALKK